MTDQGAATLAQVEGLCFSYPQRPLFSGWSARFPPGLSLLQGGDGSGKTTLLRLIAGEQAADSGSLLVAGCSLELDATAYRARVFRTDPRVALPPQATPLEWLASLRTRYAGFDHDAVPALLAQLRLDEHQHKPMYMLSTGSRRKVWLVAAFACAAPLTLVDEPFAALDKVSIGQVLALLRAVTALPGRAWVLADYETPPGLPLAQTLLLG